MYPPSVENIGRT